LFDFLLKKEFTSFWNLYLLFLVVPFAFKAITPFFGFIAAVLYILFFYLLCVLNSLIVSFANNLVKRSAWYYIPVAVFVILPVVFSITGKLDAGSLTQHAGDALLNNNLLIWFGLIALFIIFWIINRKQMRSEIYRELQGEKVNKISSFSKLSFLGQFGEIGEFIQLEIRLILRAKRLKKIWITLVYFLFMFVLFLYKSKNKTSEIDLVNLIIIGIITPGSLGIIMGQFIFSTESSFFDGLMARNGSIYTMLKAKYFLYSFYAMFVTLILIIPVFQGKLSFLSIVANFFYITGPIFFIIFQNAVYNKTYFDIFSSGWMNWQGQSGSMMIISMITLFVPIALVYMIFSFFGKDVNYWFMLITGIAFTLTSQHWLHWTYNRFMKRRHQNMEGFRVNG